MDTRLPAVVVVGLALALAVGCDEKSETSSQDTNRESAEEKTEKKQQKEVEFDASNPASVGMVVVETDKSFEDATKALEKHVEESSRHSMVASIDHQENAKSVEMEVQPTRTYVVSSPEFDLRFLEKGIQSGLDYPKKLVVWQTSDETVRISVNAPVYPVERHGLERLKLALGDQENQLGEIVAAATGNEEPTFPKADELGVDEGQGIVRKTSQNGVSDTFEKLESLVSERDGVSVMGTFDFQMVAKSIDRELAPGKLMLVGNPELGTPLMKESPSVGLDLPQKIYVSGTRQGRTLVTYNDPEYLAERHGISTDLEAIQTMSSALDSLVSEACEEIND